MVMNGGMVIGEIPRPEQDFGAWAAYLGAAHDALAAA